MTKNFYCLILTFFIFACKNLHATPDDQKFTSPSKFSSSKNNETVKENVENFFRQSSCLPNELKKILLKTRNSAIPTEVAKAIQDIENNKINTIIYQGLSATLHAYKFEGLNEMKYLEGAETYSNLNPFALANTQKIKLLYRLDCSGYVATLAKSDVGFTAANIQSAAKVAFDNNETFILSRLRVATIIAKVLEPDITPSAYRPDTETISALLFTLLNTLELNRKEFLHTPQDFEVLMYQNSGNTSIQGNIELNGNAGGVFGFGSASVDLQSKASINQSLIFDFPTVAILDDGQERVFSKNTVKDKLKIALEKTKITPKREENNLLIKTNLHENLCRSDWGQRINKVGDPTQKGDDVNQIIPIFDPKNGECIYSFDLSETTSGDILNIELIPTSDVFKSYGNSPPRLKYRYKKVF